MLAGQPRWLKKMNPEEDWLKISAVAMREEITALEGSFCQVGVL